MFIQFNVGRSWLWLILHCISLHRIISTHVLRCVLIIAWHIFIRVDATKEAAYELITEPIQEPQAGEPQADEAAEQAKEEIANPADLQGKPRSITHKFSILMFI